MAKIFEEALLKSRNQLQKNIYAMKILLIFVILKMTD